MWNCPYHYNRRDNKIWIRWYFQDTFSRHIQVQDCYSGGCESPSHFHTSHCTRSIRSTRSTHHPLMKNCLKDIVFSFIDYRSRRSVLLYFFQWTCYRYKDNIHDRNKTYTMAVVSIIQSINDFTCKYANFHTCIEDFYPLWKFKIYNLPDSLFFLMCVYLCGLYKSGFYINELIKNVFRIY